jgi:hypothetical protein
LLYRFYACFKSGYDVVIYDFMMKNDSSMIKLLNNCKHYRTNAVILVQTVQNTIIKFERLTNDIIYITILFEMTEENSQ